jgi:hypothetical protein
MATRQGPVCEWCNQALAPAGAPGEPVPPPSPMAPARPMGAITDRAVIQYVEPLSYLKNAAVLALVYVAISQGIGYALRGAVGRFGSPSGFPLMATGGTALSFVISLVTTLVAACLLVFVFNVVARWTNGFPVRFREQTAWAATTRELTRIDPVSALLVGLVTGAIGGLLVGVLGAVLVTAAMRFPGAPTAVSGVPIAALMLLGVPVWCGVWSGLAGAVLSLIYNLLAPAWGGVRFQTAAQ